MRSRKPKPKLYQYSLLPSASVETKMLILGELVKRHHRRNLCTTGWLEGDDALIHTRYATLEDRKLKLRP
jgi:hypothetical protein